MVKEEFKKYRKNTVTELRPYVEGELMGNISVASEDFKNGSPKPGDMIARNPNNYRDMWLVSKQYFDDNFVEAGE